MATKKAKSKPAGSPKRMGWGSGQVKITKKGR